MEAIAASEIDTTIYFYNPNIHPKEEYEIRKDENIRFAEKLGFDFIDADYDKDNWFERVKGLEDAPERGERCTVCFDMRFERSALFAHENKFDVFATTRDISIDWIMIFITFNQRCYGITMSLIITKSSNLLDKKCIYNE